MKIETDPYVQNWLSNYDEKQKTQRLNLLKQFCEFAEKTPTELLLEHRNDIYNEDPLQIKNIGKKRLLDFFNYLISKKKISNNSARQYAFSKIASFFKRNNVPISFDKKEVPLHNPKGVIDKVWRNGDESRIEETKRIECLKQIRDTFPHLRDKAIFLCKLASGLDDIDLFNLKVDDFEKGINEFDICYIEGNRKKNQMYYQTFFSSEAVRMIELYLKETSNESWLFTNLKGNKCKYNTFSQALSSVCEKLNIKNITPKSLRRYFNTILKRGKIDFEIRERLMGHKVEISKGSAYDEILNDSYSLAKYYSEKIEILTLLGNGNRKITNVEAKIEKLEETIIALYSENEILKAQLNSIEGFLMEKNPAYKKMVKKMKTPQKLNIKLK